MRAKAENELSNSRSRVSVTQNDEISNNLKQSFADTSYSKPTNYANQSKTKESFYPAQVKKRNEPLERSLLREKSKEKLDQTNTKFFYEDKKYSIKDVDYAKTSNTNSSHIGHQLAQYFKEQKVNYRASDHDVLRDKSRNRQIEEKNLRRSVSKKLYPAESVAKTTKAYFAPSKKDHSNLAENIPSYFNQKKKYIDYAQQITNENMHSQKIGVMNGSHSRNKSIGRPQGR